MIYNIKNSQSIDSEVQKGTKNIKILSKQVSKDMLEPLISLFFPILGAHMSKLKSNTHILF
jgi:hypothetical protein